MDIVIILNSNPKCLSQYSRTALCRTSDSQLHQVCRLQKSKGIPEGFEMRLSDCK